jgi:hypothetical protein
VAPAIAEAQPVDRVPFSGQCQWQFTEPAVVIVEQIPPHILALGEHEDAHPFQAGAVPLAPQT